MPLRHSGGIVLDADRIYASITEILSSFALSTYLRADKSPMSTGLQDDDVKREYAVIGCAKGVDGGGCGRDYLAQR